MVLDDILYQYIRIGHDCHVERDEQLEIGPELLGSCEHLTYSIRHPLIRADIQGETIDTVPGCLSNVSQKKVNIRIIRVSHHVVAEHTFLVGQRGPQQ